MPDILGTIEREPRKPQVYGYAALPFRGVRMAWTKRYHQRLYPIYYVPVNIGIQTTLNAML